MAAVVSQTPRISIRHCAECKMPLWRDAESPIDGHLCSLRCAKVFYMRKRQAITAAWIKATRWRARFMFTGPHR